MKIRLIRQIRLITLLAFFTGVTSHAAGLSLFGSYWNPTDFQEGYGPGAVIQFDFIDYVGLEFRGAWYPDMAEDVETAAGTVDLDLEVIPVEVGVFLGLFDDEYYLQPYGSIGLSYHVLEMTSNGPGGKETLDLDDEVGYYITAGARLELSPNMYLFGEGQYRTIEGTVPDGDIEDIDEQIDIDLSGLAINIGIAFAW